MPISINPGSLVIDLHPRQMEVLKCPANEIFWGGSCGGGKSFLARALAIILCLELPEFSAFLFEKNQNIRDKAWQKPRNNPPATRPRFVSFVIRSALFGTANAKCGW